jgi:hypothetical protein
VPLLAIHRVVGHHLRLHHLVGLDRKQPGIGPKRARNLTRLCPHHLATQPNDVGASGHGTNMVQAFAELAADRRQLGLRIFARDAELDDETIDQLIVSGWPRPS